MDGGSERRREETGREGERVGEDEHEDKNFYLNKKTNNAIALKCSMRLH